MRDSMQPPRGIAAAIVATAGFLGWPALASADVSGEAAAVKSTVFGVSASLADTGNLTGAGDMEQASQLTGGIPSVLSADVLHATTSSAPDEVVSQASIADVTLTLVGNTISLGNAVAQATAPSSGPPSGFSQVQALVVNGVPVTVTGQPNQVISLIGGKIVLNEQQLTSNGGEVVNAVHVVLTGIADVVIGTASAGMAGSSILPPLLPPLLGSLERPAQLDPSDALMAASVSCSGVSRRMACAPARKAVLTI